MLRKGRIIINTGDGKGKTTAALGMAFRALGHGHNVCVIQFIKGQGDYGERLLAPGLDRLEWYVFGKGFIFNKENIAADKEIVRQGFQLAREKIESDAFDLLILDEFTYLPLYGFLEREEILPVMRNRPQRLTVVITGRGAPDYLVALADTVSEIKAVKHAYEQGITAQKGVEF